MKIKQPKIGVEIVGRIPSLGVTKYVRNGSVVTRVSTSSTGRKGSRKQFAQRQRMRHSLALWQNLKPCDPLFTEGKTAYLNFLSLANSLPVAYWPKRKGGVEGSFLMPGIPVSDGTLPPHHQHLGEVDGTPAFLTDYMPKDYFHPAFLLYTAEQRFRGLECPDVHFSVRVVNKDEFVQVDGCLALVGSEFADENKGWALVRVAGKSCSRQSIITRCKVYEQYTTEEALQKAAKTYGGVGYF